MTLPLTESSVGLNAAQAVIGTKAETLSRLRAHLKKAKVPDLLYFTIEQWRDDQSACLEQMRAKFAARKVAVRSSSLAEDCWNASNAGAFKSLLNVCPQNEEEFVRSVNEVVASYGPYAPDNQVLVQEMVGDVALSGVLFTRSIDFDAPYYVVNYDDRSGLTDTVTGGCGKGLRTVFAFKELPGKINKVDKRLAAVIEAAKEIESLTCHGRLDIEFAVAGDSVSILQVRPLVKNGISRSKVDDATFGELLKKAAAQISSLQRRHPYLSGKSTCFGVMPDANPAELIGIKPRPLAFSLYRHLITDDLFASVRAQYGYRDVAPYPMMVSLLGQPFVDARVSFNSLTPAEISTATADAIINACITKLASTPNLHDKVEFDVVVNCWFPGVDKVVADRFNGLTEHDKSAYVTAMRDLTYAAIARIDQDVRDTQPLRQRFDDVIDSELPALRKAFVLLEDAQRLGASPFIRLARSGFVAMAMLKGLVAREIITQAQFDDFMSSLNTVSKQIEASAYSVKTGRESLDHMVRLYGHLRPGTYDILSPAYFEDAERFLSPIVEAAKNVETVGFAWGEQSTGSMQKVFDDAGLNISVSQFEEFCREAIEGREYGKFVYTKNMSYALEYVRLWGQENGLSRDDLSFLKWPYLRDLALSTGPLDKQVIFDHIDAARKEYQLHQAVELPSLVSAPDDVFAFEQLSAQANFITSKSVTSGLAVLDVQQSGQMDLSGKIVMIPGADPGYDWLFSQDIGGLITMFGGANSHMAIRAAEQRLPAAIGVGQKIYDAISKANTVALNCGSRTIKAIN
jgi:hypothetical protein